MSMSIVAHVRDKSQSKNSARACLLNLAIYANDCCGVAWPADATLSHEAHVSRQRIHELKNVLEAMGELVILERPGTTNLYFVAWQGKPLGGTSAEHPRVHDPRCPLRHPAAWDRVARLWPDRYPPRVGAGEGSECSDTPADLEGSEMLGGGQSFQRGGVRILCPKNKSKRERKQLRLRRRSLTRLRNRKRPVRSGVRRVDMPFPPACTAHVIARRSRSDRRQGRPARRCDGAPLRCQRKWRWRER